MRLGTTADEAAVLDLEPDAVVIASGAEPYRSALTSVTAWDVLRGDLPAGERVLVADWGGDPSGLDAAEVLAAAGRRVTYAIASVAAAEPVHQYRRNLYLQRLYRAGVTIRHHLELESVEDGQALLRNVFARELVERLEVDAVVAALGRIPAATFEVTGIPSERVGDCRSPRSLEEAVLEGTLASRALAAA